MTQKTLAQLDKNIMDAHKRLEAIEDEHYLEVQYYPDASGMDIDAIEVCAKCDTNPHAPAAVTFPCDILTQAQEDYDDAYDAYNAVKNAK